MRFLIRVETYDCGDYTLYYPEIRNYRVPDLAKEVSVFCIRRKDFRIEYKYRKEFKAGFTPSPTNAVDEIFSNIITTPEEEPFNFKSPDFKKFIDGSLSYNIEKSQDGRYWIVKAKFAITAFVLDITDLEEFVKVISECTNSIDKFTESDEIIFPENMNPDYTITFS